MMMPPPPSKVPAPIRKVQGAVQDIWTNGGHQAFHYTVIPAIFAYGLYQGNEFTLNPVELFKKIVFS
ncbi:hypothetical protein FOL46_000047 [Perkinsus olseni]|uniref:Uncharacterized protein n=1 Tax=Perkinsus olseni TaxID=32597 RepID=A0A7J6SDA5_PEROL|nr:hypothetical protein FOL46_000047 [Perkinsus olseni]KAF4721461.1 hypothetical protein FOZ63_018791 [Perkinsus olseni]KAF4730741.1 hypothetical protein FOZ62_010312 [Perkinsus olseni]